MHQTHFTNTQHQYLAPVRPVRCFVTSHIQSIKRFICYRTLVIRWEWSAIIYLYTAVVCGHL